MAPRLHVAEFPAPNPGAASPPIIFLIHGGASSGRMYGDVIPHLNKQGFSVVVPDLPGHGQTARASNSSSPSPPPSTFSFSAATESLHALLQTQKQRHPSSSLVVVGISLGGQVVLDLISTHPDAVQAAIVSGASIHPPDDRAAWEMPRLPTDSERWMKVLTEDVELMGMENAKGVQDASFGFTFDGPREGASGRSRDAGGGGEKDVAMARRDFEEVAEKVRSGNGRSEKLVLEGAWHNHSVDVPERFAEVVGDWVRKCGL